MIPPLLIVAGVVVVILAAMGIKGGATAAHQPGATATPSGGYGASGILVRYAAQLAKYGAPMPAPALALIMYRESGGKPTAIAKGAVTGADEIGLAQLTVETTGDRGEAQLADVDPLDPTGAIYGVEHNYDWIRERLAVEIADLGFDPVTDARDWIVLMHLGRSIGYAGTVRIVETVKDKADNVVAAIRALATGPESAVPKLGRQSPSLVAKRLRKALALPDDAAKLGMLPSTLGELPERGDDVPHFDRAKTNRATGRA